MTTPNFYNVKSDLGAIEEEDEFTFQIASYRLVPNAMAINIYFFDKIY